MHHVLDLPTPSIQGKSNSSLSDRDKQLMYESFCSVGMNTQGALETKIHPIFRWSNWQTILDVAFGTSRARDAWASMAPAFILATKMLTSPMTEGFWHHLMCGVLDDGSSLNTAPHLAPTHMGQDPEFLRANFKKLLEGLTDRVKFYWQTNSDFHATFTPCFWSVLGRIDPELRSEVQGRNRHLVSRVKGKYLLGYIGINPAYLYALLRPRRPSPDGINERARVQLSLALTLCHELSHAIWILRNFPYEEVRIFPTDLVNEVGESFEHWLGAGAHLDLELDDPLQLSQYSVYTWEFVYLSPTMGVHVEDSFAEAMFRAATWESQDAYAAAWPRPTGKPSRFSAQRYIRSGPLAGTVQDVEYVNGQPTGEGLECLKHERGPAGQNVNDWFREVRARDMNDASETGKWAIVRDQVAKGLFGYFLEYVGEDEEPIGGEPNGLPDLTDCGI